ncbi:hypothetical protein QA584_26270 [Anaerocolumna sp. AGMB13025]|uniref:hypothetical protein n=1 Tax=Anaerocolumna sp. AGMB13025 TaxID=3039116 RepID=UPI00241D6B31|nr:hypothetical protein [Anaerocolumna sp. AGMB13025]WFR57077.1 hypothetical protein QA584_26270 [Anaerocolumna sp. AGMB13025]
MNKRIGIKNAVSKRKISCVLLIICLMLLTACMSREERELASKNEALAKTIVQEYLDLNYGSGEVTSEMCLIIKNDDKLSFLATKRPSSYVRVSVLVNKKEFQVFTNIETGQCYDNYNDELIAEDFKNYAIDTLSIDNPYEIELHYYRKGLYEELIGGDNVNFAEYGIKSAEDLFKNNQYDIYLECKYIDSDMDFGSIDTKGFFPAAEVSDIYLALINFRSKDRYNNGNLISHRSYYRLSGPEYGYRASDIITSYRVRNYDEDSDTYIYDDTVFCSYSRYRSETMNGIEFVWNERAYALDLKEIPAEKEIKKEKETYHSIDGKAVSVVCTPLLVNKYGMDDSIHFYFDKSKTKNKLIIDERNGNPEGFIKVYMYGSGLRDADYLFDFKMMHDDVESFTVGLYKEE